MGGWILFNSMYNDHCMPYVSMFVVCIINSNYVSFNFGGFSIAIAFQILLEEGSHG